MNDQPTVTANECDPNPDEELLTLDEAVDFLRGAYARRTLQNLAWEGTLRCVGRGQKMRFLRRWLLDDLLAVRRIADKEIEYEYQREDHSWSSEKAHPGAATIDESARDVRSPAARNRSAQSAGRRPRRASRLSGTSTVGANGNSRTAGASKMRPRFFGARKRTTGDSKT